MQDFSKKNYDPTTFRIPSSALNEETRMDDNMQVQPAYAPSSKPRINSRDVLLCFICNKVTSRKSISRHMKTVHDLQNFSMRDYDPTKFMIPSSAFKEELRMNYSDDTIRDCRWCSKTFTKHSSLVEHLFTFHTELYVKEQHMKPIGCSFYRGCVNESEKAQHFKALNV
jgi:hypothetical protein